MTVQQEYHQRGTNMLQNMPIREPYQLRLGVVGSTAKEAELTLALPIPSVLFCIQNHQPAMSLSGLNNIDKD